MKDLDLDKRILFYATDGKIVSVISLKSRTLRRMQPVSVKNAIVVSLTHILRKLFVLQIDRINLLNVLFCKKVNLRNLKVLICI